MVSSIWWIIEYQWTDDDHYLPVVTSVNPCSNVCQDFFTIIASANIYMSAHHRRWLSLREMLTLQGFPVTAEFTYGKPCSSFALRHVQSAQGLPFVPWPSRRAACHQSGNSMHVCVSGLAILFCLSQIKMDQGMLALQRFQRKRLVHQHQPTESRKKAKLWIRSVACWW